MDKINEVQTLTNIRLSHAQKYVLTKLQLPNQTPLTAYSSVSSDENVVANRDVLVKLGMVIIGDNSAEITEKGIKALSNENLIDEMGNLTEQGEQYAYAKGLVDIENLAAQEKRPEVPEPEQTPEIDNGTPPPLGISPNDNQPISFESWSMISDMQEELSQRDFLANKSIKTKL